MKYRFYFLHSIALVRASARGMCRPRLRRAACDRRAESCIPYQKPGFRMGGETGKLRRQRINPDEAPSLFGTGA